MAPNESDTGRVMAAEAIGTAILIMGGPGAAIIAGDRIGTLGIAFAFGLSLLTAAYLVGHISGCHVNPAVTLAWWITRKIETPQAVAAVIGQIIGGFLGATIVFGIASGLDGYDRGTFAANGWGANMGSGYGLGATIVVEVVFTALLVLVLLGSTYRNFPATIGGLLAGLTLTLIHLVTIPVDNTSVNPVRSLVTAVFAWDKDPLSQLWVFIVFPLIGSMLGVVVWLVVDDEVRLEDTRLDTEVTRTVRDAADTVGDKVSDAVDDATD
jgi:aquaporin Z